MVRSPSPQTNKQKNAIRIFKQLHGSKADRESCRPAMLVQTRPRVPVRGNYPVRRWSAGSGGVFRKGRSYDNDVLRSNVYVHARYSLSSHRSKLRASEYARDLKNKNGVRCLYQQVGLFYLLIFFHNTMNTARRQPLLGLSWYRELHSLHTADRVNLSHLERQHPPNPSTGSPVLARHFFPLCYSSTVVYYL